MELNLYKIVQFWFIARRINSLKREIMGLVIKLTSLNKRIAASERHHNNQHHHQAGIVAHLRVKQMPAYARGHPDREEAWLEEQEARLQDLLCTIEKVSTF